MYSGEEDKAHLSLDSGLPGEWQAIPVLHPLLVGVGITDSATVGTSALVMGRKALRRSEWPGSVSLSSQHSDILLPVSVPGVLGL